ncbi:GNAT family N-acetyltransferase [Paenibacillus nasutitermitis]|nr:acetyltransferase [Paenibacillus nasutitermitis]
MSEITSIELITADEHDKPILRNLMQYYQYDSSAYTNEDPGRFGLFDYKYLDHYWTDQGKEEEGRQAFLVKVNHMLGGFVLVNNHSILKKPGNETKTIAEFFIMRKWRRQGVGKEVAYKTFEIHKGIWEIKQEKENIGAQRFWENVINEYTAGNFKRVESVGDDWDGPVIWFDNSK